MAGLLFNKFKEDMIRVLLVRELRGMLQVQGETMQLVKQGWLSVITVRVKGTWQGSVLNLRGQGTLHGSRKRCCWFRHKKLTDDLDAYDSDCDDISSAKAVLMANLSSYDSDDKANLETKTVNESLTAELERYKELVKTFEQRLNIDLSSREKFIDSQMNDMIWDRNELNELNEVKTTFNQMEAAVEQCSIDKKYFDIQKKELSLDNDRLLDHIICQDMMNNVMHVDSIPANVLPANNKCLVELAKKEHMVEKKFFDEVVLSLKGKNVVEKDFPLNKAKVIAPKMFKLDLEPLAPKVLRNRDAHIDYIRHSMEHADTLREIVENARALRPLDSNLNSSCQWKPTRRTFIIDGNTCPLTRITSTNIVPLKETTSKSVTTKNPEVKVYSRRPKVTKSVGSSRKSKIVKSRISSNSEPNQSWGSNDSNVPSSSLVDFRLSKFFSEVVATSCFTQNQSLIRKRHNKTPYEIPQDLYYLYVFGALYYLTNDSEDLGKLKPKANIGIFSGYAPTKKAYRIYNKRTRLIIETIHVDFDELTTMSSEQFSSRPRPQLLTPRTISSGLVPNPPSPTLVASLVPAVVALVPDDSTDSPSST
ncbi:retrovirus-related pol polyprotein from transposon TNT 1-94 [Tanacetum coccineum]